MAGLSTASELDAFFGGLPATSLTPLEASLRQALLDFVRARWPRPFPLSEWIDRRIGGELEVRRSETGQAELQLRGATRPEAEAAPAPPSGPGEREAFFAGLEPGAFGAAEELLRDAVFEFLARWRSRELATLMDLTADAGVRRRAAEVLPASVTLKEWVEQRIGGEVEFKWDSVRGQEIVHLSPSARPYVTAKYEQIAAGSSRMSGMPSAGPAGGKGQGELRQPAAAQPPAAQPPAAQPPPAAAQPPTAPSRDASFFASLPTNELAPGELALRGALLGYIEEWPQLSAQFGKPPGAYPLLSDMSQDQQVQRARAAFLPPAVSLREWIDRRIGGEIELRKDSKGLLEAWLRGAAPPGGRRPVAGATAPGESRPAEIEDFFGRLPAEEHSDAEAQLRLAILDYMQVQGRDADVQMAEITKDRRVSQCRLALLPNEVQIRTWIDRRIGGEVETWKDEKGRVLLRMRPGGQVDGEPGPDKEVQKEQFFASLPQDGFTPDEERLREALLEFLGMWQGKEPPTLSQAGGEARIKKCRAKVLPKSVPVTLRDWIDRRIGGEVEMVEGPSGQWHFGLRGRLGLAWPGKRGQGVQGGEAPPRKRRP